MIRAPRPAYSPALLTGSEAERRRTIAYWIDFRENLAHEAVLIGADRDPLASPFQLNPIAQHGRSPASNSMHILRSLAKEIILTPEKGALAVDVRGDLAGILAVAA